MNGYDRIRNEYATKKVLVMGLGMLGGGIGTANFFAYLGAEVRVTDLKKESKLAESISKLDKKIVKSLGGHNEADFVWAEVIIRNPAVPGNHEWIVKARELGKSVVMETALFAKYSELPIVGVTGTRGKTTTTMMIYETLNNLGISAGLGGNAIRSSTLELLKSERDGRQFTILELSSWQIQGFDDLRISPQYAVITNIYPDHLNRYESMEDYIKDKAAIFKYQKLSDKLFVNRDDATVIRIAKNAGSNVIEFGESDLETGTVLSIPGKHNRSNAAACLAVVVELGVDRSSAIKTIKEFKGVAYRLEQRKIIEGVVYINDTTSTTPVATIIAIEAITKPVWLILGGNSKNLPLEEFVEVVNQDAGIKGVLLIPGTGTDEIEELIEKDKLVGKFDDVETAVKKAKSMAISGDAVLFSPGFTSFGQFNNELERGDYFNKLVDKL